MRLELGSAARGLQVSSFARLDAPPDCWGTGIPLALRSCLKLGIVSGEQEDRLATRVVLCCLHRNLLWLSNSLFVLPGPIQTFSAFVLVSTCDSWACFADSSASGEATPLLREEPNMWYRPFVLLRDSGITFSMSHSINFVDL